MRILNIGILAHVDAGKTSLTERLLFRTGAIGRLGSVDDGSTQTDSGAIERRRGITIRTAVASFTVPEAGRELRVNLIDTPGHADFVAEVERALGVLDGAVLVLSAVEGVQPHSRLLMKTLRRLRVPTLIFINKIDRAGAREGELLADVRRWLTPYCVPLNTVRHIGSPDAGTEPMNFATATNATSVADTAAATDAAKLVDTTPPADTTNAVTATDLTNVTNAADVAAEVLAEHDDSILELLVEGRRPSGEMLRAAMAQQCADGVLHPVVFGSAMTGQGVGDLLDAFGLLPATVPGEGDPDEAVRGTVFAIERGHAGEKLAYVRMRSGTLQARQRVRFFRPSTPYERSGAPYERSHTMFDGGGATYEGRPTAIQVAGSDAAEAVAGDIAKVRGVPGIRVGDHLGAAPDDPGAGHFLAPTLETVVRPRVPGQEGRLHAALAALAEQDPLIGTRALPGGETSVLLYGEVQKEVIAETLAEEFGVAAEFEPTRPVLLERPVRRGEAVEEILRHGRNEFCATVGLRVEPAPIGSGVGYRMEVDLGSLPLAFHRAIEDTVRDSLAAGPRGWPVTDVLITLIRSGYSAPVSTAADFRGRTPLVLMQALRQAGTRVYEPCHRFELEVPPEALSAATARLSALGAEVADVERRGEAWLVGGDIPAAVVHEFELSLPGLSHGEGVWWSEPSGDRPTKA
ncbi:elongation factor G [Nonomuraea rhizosphaerae]|uniref:elongation factor G n=1 Tax=Nonomuraea rhizosphaerae TaxID=2665663 RepID=UPI001C5F78A2|nr:TetM/TetW/TetO/TetS family tetracycline resistance ribosomal protection protein [Nonomuraea rhizosphaerae]